MTRRAIRLKEFAPLSVIRNTPSDWYIQSKDSSLKKKEYLIRTDEHGFILSGPNPTVSANRLVVLGDSVVEGMFVEEEARLCSRVEALLNDVLPSKVQVLNAGYSGATSLHLYNLFINKLVPIKPTAVLLMSGIVDTDVAMRAADYWTSDCWLEPIVDFDLSNKERDCDFRPEPDYSSRRKILSMFQFASETFDIPVWYATVPHRHVFEGEYVRKAYSERSAFDREVAAHGLVNASTREFALQHGLTLFDLESRLVGVNDLYYDMYHHNFAGGGIIARSLLEAGLPDAIIARLRSSGSPDLI